MKRALRLRLVFATFWLAAAVSSGGQDVIATAELNLGISAYKNARYEEAEAHFVRAVSLDPVAIRPHLYLATCYAQQYIPGAKVKENDEIGPKAIAEYQKVIELDANNIDAVKGAAYLYSLMKQQDLAREYYKKVTVLTPNDPEPYYSIAVMDWTQAYDVRMGARAKLNLKPEFPMIRKEVCWKIQAANQQVVEDGIEMLSRALDLRPDYGDAMAYLNLMYRERADIQCGNTQASESDIKMADKWVDAVMTIKKSEASRARKEVPDKQ